jgi:hypothetical protein
MNKEEIISLAMERLGWTERKVRSWYKKENNWLKGNSPKELVERGESEIVVEFLMSRQKDLDEDDKGEDVEPKEEYEVVFKKDKKKKLWFKP